MWTAALGLVLAAAAQAQQPMQPVVATYFGGPGGDQARAGAFGPDGTLFIAGAIPGEPGFRLGVKPEGDGEGILLRLKAATFTPVTAARFAGVVTDVEVDAKSNVFVTGKFGTAKMDRLGLKAVWSNAVGSGEEGKLGLGANGAVVVLAGKKISVLDDKEGATTTSWDVDLGAVADMAVDEKSKQVFVIGTRTFPKAIDGEHDYTTLAVHAFDMTGKLLWKAYDWPMDEATAAGCRNNTRGQRIAVGEDGMLYVAATSNSGLTPLMRQPRDLKSEVPGPKNADEYQQGFATSRGPLTWMVRMDAKTGRAQISTIFLSRDHSSAPAKGLPIRATAIAADKMGTVYLGAFAEPGGPISPAAFGASFSGSGALLAVFDRNFNRVFSDMYSSGEPLDIVLYRNAAAILGKGATNFTTHKPFQKDAGGDEDSWLVVIRK